jgi:hypothetical protein
MIKSRTKFESAQKGCLGIYSEVVWLGLYPFKKMYLEQCSSQLKMEVLGFIASLRRVPRKLLSLLVPKSHLK